MTTPQTVGGLVAVVTGATRGLGRSIALELARRGARVAAVGRSTADAPHTAMPGTLEDTRAALEATGAPAITIRADLTDSDAVDSVVARTLEWAGRCDILVNNASYTPAGGFLDIPVSRWRTGMAITVMAPVRLAQGFLPGMLQHRSGRILNIGSAAGAYRTSALEALPYPIADTPLLYCVTKAALERLTTGLHDTYSSSGISVNNLRAGQMATEAWHYMREKTGFHDPVESVHTPEEVANAACWMLEQAPSFSGYILDFPDLIRRGVLPARG